MAGGRRSRADLVGESITGGDIDGVSGECFTDPSSTVKEEPEGRKRAWSFRPIMVEGRRPSGGRFHESPPPFTSAPQGFGFPANGGRETLRRQGGEGRLFQHEQAPAEMVVVDSVRASSPNRRIMKRFQQWKKTERHFMKGPSCETPSVNGKGISTGNANPASKG